MPRRGNSFKLTTSLRVTLARKNSLNGAIFLQPASSLFDCIDMRKKQPLSQLRCHLPYEGSLALSLPGMLQAVMPRTGHLRLSYLTE